MAGGNTRLYRDEWPPRVFSEVPDGPKQALCSETLQVKVGVMYVTRASGLRAVNVCELQMPATTYANAYVCIQICMYVCIYIYHIYTSVHKHVYTYAHTCTCTCT